MTADEPRTGYKKSSSDTAISARIQERSGTTSADSSGGVVITDGPDSEHSYKVGLLLGEFMDDMEVHTALRIEDALPIVMNTRGEPQEPEWQGNEFSAEPGDCSVPTDRRSGAPMSRACDAR